MSMSWPQSAEPSAGAGAGTAPRRQLSLEKLRAYFERRRFDRDERKRLLAEAAEQRRLLETTAETAPIAAELEPETETAAPAPVVAEGPYSIPSIDLLNPADPPDPAANNDDLEANRRIIQDTLDSFGIDAEVGNATSGPRVTLFEINMARGVKVEAISNIVNNLAMELKAISLRVLTPVPGQNFVGLEVPNRISTKIAIGELLGGRLWKTSRAGIPLPLGRNIRGEDVVLDLAKAPHLLIAGATGSGKSVCLNAILMSIIYRFPPEDLKLILVDPKVVEFSVYNGLPHLLVPVVTDPKCVVLALRWVIREMEKRYRILAKARVRNIDGFNHRPPSETPELDDAGEPIPAKLPYIVLIIDELADIMMTARADVETSLARIAQLSRAVGIHTVIATQRPSVNVITGVIKANYPTRIAFQVASQIDSRTIMDTKGAESLLGRGDMLFIAPGAAKPERLQCPLVEDAEIERGVRFVAGQVTPKFDTAILTGGEVLEASGGGAGGGEDDDPLLQQAIEIIVRERRASTSYLQRRLKIGYNKAASLIDLIEQRGVIGPQIGSGTREIIWGEEALGQEEN